MAYRSFQTTTWQDPWFENLTPRAKLAFIYLWTNDVCNQAGFYRVSEKRINFELGFKFKEVSDELQPKVIWYTDEDIIWVKAFFKRQCANEKFMVGAFNCLSEFNEIQASNFLAYNRDYIKAITPKITTIHERYRLHTLVIPLLMGIESLCLSVPGTDTDTDISPLAQKSDQIDKDSTQKATQEGKDPAQELARESDFDQFWQSWPKKKSKADALKAWKQTSKTRPNIEAILSKIEALKNSQEWKKEKGEFIPYPATWLRDGGWDDEVNQKETEMTPEQLKDWGEWKK